MPSVCDRNPIVKNRRSARRFGAALVALLSLFFLCGCRDNHNAASPSADSLIKIIDKCGRKVAVPKKATRILATGAVDMVLAYMLAPDKLMGFNVEPNGDFIPAKYRNLPVLGGWHTAQSGNYESFIAADPDMIFAGGPENIERMQSRFGSIPVVCLDRWNGFESYEDSIRLLGRAAGEEEKTEELIAWHKEAVRLVASRTSAMPEEKKIRVYYAEGKKGLNTEPSGSPRTELIKVCGGVNVAAIDMKNDKRQGMAEVSMELVLKWNPEVIIIGRGAQNTLKNEIMSHTVWKNVEAARSGRVYVRPDNPFSWFDGPPGPNQIVGIYWTAKILYPELFSDIDLRKKTRDFYSKFYHYELSESQLSSLIGDL